MTQAAPFASGSIALGLHVAPGNPADAIVRLRSEAIAAEVAGFDGVGLSEHHGGFAGYLPSPLMMIGVVLGDTEEIWGAPCPVVLPLRNTSLLIEDLAWLNAAYPGRVGAAFVSGYQERDFEAVGMDFDSRTARFREALPVMARAMAGSATGPIGEDSAIAALTTAPIPVLIGAGGPQAARRAAKVDAGILLTSVDGLETGRRIAHTYQDAGGTGSRTLIRRIWIGASPSNAGLMAAYRAQDTADALPHVPHDAVCISGTPEEVVARVTSDCREVGADSLNLRVFALDHDSDSHLSQIKVIGETVLPSIRRELGWSM